MWAEIDEWGSIRIAETIQELKGFYVKTGDFFSFHALRSPGKGTSRLLCPGSFAFDIKPLV